MIGKKIQSAKQIVQKYLTEAGASDWTSASQPGARGTKPAAPAPAPAPTAPVEREAEAEGGMPTDSQGWYSLLRGSDISSFSTNQDSRKEWKDLADKLGMSINELADAIAENGEGLCGIEWLYIMTKNQRLFALTDFAPLTGMKGGTQGNLTFSYLYGGPRVRAMKEALRGLRIDLGALAADIAVGLASQQYKTEPPVDFGQEPLPSPEFTILRSREYGPDSTISDQEWNVLRQGVSEISKYVNLIASESPDGIKVVVRGLR